MARSLDIIDPKRELSRERDESREENEFKDEPDDERGGGTFYLVIGIIAVIVAVGSALFVIYRDKGAGSDTKSTVTKTATPIAPPSPSPSPSASISATAQASSTSVGSQFASDSVRIANGNGVNGEASRIKKLLEAKGYKITSTGNASRTYTETIIYYKTGKDALAKSLQTDLAGEYTGEINESDKVVGIYDAVIALGAK